MLHLALALTLAASPAPPHPFAEVAQQFGVAVGTLKYADENGKPMTLETFAPLVDGGGRGFNIVKDAKTGTVTLKLMSVEQMMALQAAMAKPSAMKVGTALPPFKLKDLAGKTITDADLRGRYTVLSFFFAACVPCIAEVPVLNQLAAKTKRADLTFLAVTFDPEATAREYVGKHKLTWPTLYGASVINDALGVDRFPVLALIDKKGTLAAVYAGDEDNVTLPPLLAWLEGATAAAR